MASAVAYYVQGLCMRVKGPVFATAFSPLVMIIVAVMGSVILSENIYLGRFVICVVFFLKWVELSRNYIRLDKWNCGG